MGKKFTAAVSVAAALQLAAAVGFAAASDSGGFINTFTDVPREHWAYEAVRELAEDGVIDGYGDGTFHGDRSITRYEMAELVARAMTKLEEASDADKQKIKRLEREFRNELRKMGVRISNLERKMDDVKWGAEVRLRYENDSRKGPAGKEIKDHKTEARTRLKLESKFDPKWEVFACLENTQNFRKSGQDGHLEVYYSYVQGNFGGVKMQAGRIPYIPAYGLIVDNAYNGVGLALGTKLKARLFYGRESKSAFAAKGNGDYYLVSEEVMDPANFKDIESGSKADAVAAAKAFEEQGTSALKPNNYKELLDAIDKIADNGKLKQLAYDLALAKGLQADGTFKKSDNALAKERLDTLLTELGSYSPKLDDANMAGIELSYPLDDKTNIKAAYMTFDAVNLNGPKSKMWEAGFDTQLTPDWNVKAVYGKSNADRDNKAYVLGLTYKQYDVLRPKSFDIYANYLHIERLATYDSTYSTDGVSNIIDLTTGQLHGAEGYELGANYIFNTNMRLNAHMSDVKASDDSDWKEKNYKVQVFVTF